MQPIDTQEQLAWRNLRFPLKWAPPNNVARIVADDPNLSTDQWFGFTPPRVPVLQTANEFLGTQTPVLMDIASAAQFPCQRPASQHLGVAGVPQYRISRTSSRWWCPRTCGSRRAPVVRSCSSRRC